MEIKVCVEIIAHQVGLMSHLLNPLIHLIPKEVVNIEVDLHEKNKREGNLVRLVHLPHTAEELVLHRSRWKG